MHRYANIPHEFHRMAEFLKKDPQSQVNTCLPVILLPLAIFTTMHGKGRENTANPQIGTRPTKHIDAPRAMALNISAPDRIPPSIAMGILPRATGAHSRSTSSVAGWPSS